MKILHKKQNIYINKNEINDLFPENKSLEILDCLLSEYHEILHLQHLLIEKRLQNKISNTILIVEHPSVITFGARKNANKLLISKDKLAEKDIEIVEIRRGGGTTAHNPGQLVFYPILNLKQLDLGISEYIRMLETIGAKLLESLGVASTRRKGFPGLWINKRKIASIGVRVSKFITHHGMAINIQNDLIIFDYIKPCGLEDVEMTSVLKETGNKHSMKLIKEKLSELLTEHFSSSSSKQ